MNENLEISNFNSIQDLQSNIQFKKLHYIHERTLNQQNNAHELQMQQNQFIHEDNQKAQDLGSLGKFLEEVSILLEILPLLSVCC